MSIEDFTWQGEIMERRSQGKVSQLRELLEQLFDEVFR